ncbi:MAG: HAMP domain-containing sensor histidine kinase, partial [Myxococcaceae bacterium]
LLGLGLAGIALLLAITLGLTVVRLVILSGEFEHSVAGLRAIEEIQANLFIATREHELFIQTGDRRWKAGWQAADAELVRWLAEAERLAKLPRERELAGQLAASIERIRREVLAAPPDGRSVTRAEIHQSYKHAQALADLYERASEVSAQRTARWSRTARLVSTAMLLLVAGSLVGAVFYARRLIYLPVQRIRRSLDVRTMCEETRVPREAALELREIADAVNGLIQRLAAQRMQQLTFLAAIAHDLRNPMNSLRMAAQIASRQPDPEKQVDRMKLMVRQVDRMNRLVEDLLDVNRIEAGQFDLHLEQKDLRGVVEESVALFADISKAHEVRCDVPDEPFVVKFDPARLHQVIGNLISNAIKYSPEGGPVDVRVRVQGDHAVIEVQDVGLGIPLEERESIFTPFRRSGGARGEIPGVGLGLSVARRLIRAHGGEIEVESELGRGSTFRVRLPLEQ